MGRRFVRKTGLGTRRTASRLTASLLRRRLVNRLTYDIDCLVYSSHKSGTQTLKATLDRSDIPARHIHALRNAGMASGRGAFRSYLEAYRLRNGRKLNIVSVFRLPLERHVSSFFQWYGDDVVRAGLVRGSRDNIIARRSVGALQESFIEELRQGSLVGQHDSLHELCADLGRDVAGLRFDPSGGYGVVEDDLMRLHLFRFDLFFPDFASLLGDAMDVRLIPQIDNVSACKWYGTKFLQFQTTLKVPPALIESTQEGKKDLVDVFYPGQYAEILEGQLIRYGCQP
jgi:hypothetical protein